MNKKKEIYQMGGGDFGLEGILAGFSNLFGNLTYGGSDTPPEIKPLGYAMGDQSFDTQEDLLRNYYTNQINEDIPRRRKRKRRKAYEALDKRFQSGDIYSDPESQNLIHQGKIAGISNYFSSPAFQAGAQDLFGQFSQHQQNLQSEGGYKTAVNHSPYTVGHDRGFKKGGYMYQQGGETKYEPLLSSVPMQFLSEMAGLDVGELDLLAKAVKEHESWGDYSIVQMGSGPGRGAYQFDRASMKTAANKAKKIYSSMGKKAPSVFDEILKGEITEAHQLSPGVQDELFFSSLTKVVPVKDKNGKIKRYDIEPTPTLGKHDLYSPQGLADTWQKVHNRGKVDRRESFLDSLSRMHQFEEGGRVRGNDPLRDPKFVTKHMKAEEGDMIVDSTGNKHFKDIKSSSLGYRNDSPDKGEDSLIIPGDTISMENVDMNLLLIPETGEPVIAMSNSDQLYRFPGSSYVEERPLANKGGYMEKYQMGGQVEPALIQTEKGETVVFDDYTISPVKAKKRHKNMKPTEGTDIIPPGSYIFPIDKSTVLNKKDADEISFGYGPLNYKEGETSKAPREMFFGEVFKKKRETPAQVSKNISSKFPVSTREDDPFTNKAKQENKDSRQPYIETLKILNEMNKNKDKPNFQMGGGISSMINKIYNQPTNNAITGTMYQDTRLKMDNNMKNQGVYTKPLYSQSPAMGLPGKQKFFQAGGTPDPTGAIVGAAAEVTPTILNFIGDLFGFSAGAKARKRLEANQAQTEQELDSFQARQSGRNQLGLGTGLASTVAQFATQDTDYDFLNVDPIRARTENSYKNAIDSYLSNLRLSEEKQQGPINTFYRSAAMADPRQAQGAASSMYAQYLNQSGNQALQGNEFISKLQLQGDAALNNLDFTVAQDRQKGTMYQRAAQNLLNKGLAQGLGQEFQNYLTQEGQTDMSVIAGKMGARNQLASGMNQLGQLQQDNRNQGLSSLGDLYQSVFNKPGLESPTSKVGTVGTSGTGVGSQTSGISQMYQDYTASQLGNYGDDDYYYPGLGRRINTPFK